jgi:hypothetical protein
LAVTGIQTAVFVLSLLRNGCTADADTVRSFSTAPTLVLGDVTVVDGQGTPPGPGMSVVITQGKIAQVAPTDSIAIQRG